MSVICGRWWKVAAGGGDDGGFGLLRDLNLGAEVRLHIILLLIIEFSVKLLVILFFSLCVPPLFDGFVYLYILIKFVIVHEAPNQNGYPFQGSANMAVAGFQQRPMFSQSPSHSGSQAMQQHMIQQLLQDMSNGGGGGGGGQKPSVSGQSAASGSMGRDGMRYGISQSGTSPRPPAVPTRSNSFKGASRSDSSAGGGAGNVGVDNQKAATNDLPHMCDDIVQDIASEFTGNCFFENDELEEGMGFDWKA